MKKIIIGLLIINSCFSCKNKQKQTPETPKPAPVSIDSIVACVFSQIVYTDQPQKGLDSFLPGWKIVWNPSPLNGNYAFVARKNNTLAIAIRGSVMAFNEAAFQNWVQQDLNAFTQTAWPFTLDTTGAKISDGAYEAWQNMSRLKDTATGKTLWQFLSEQLKEHTPLLVTGHSLGGNLANVYASWLAWNIHELEIPQPDISVVTFAAPAAGNGIFAADFNKKFPQAKRYENTNDMVPKFPCIEGIKQLGDLFAGGPSAKEIRAGYRGISVSLSQLFNYMGEALRLASLFGGASYYKQTNGQTFTGKLSTTGAAASLGNWFAEAGFQHSIKQYALSFGAPVVEGASK
jgi:triacylglycerol lipase